MQSFEIVKQIEPKSSFRVQAILGRYDLQSTRVRECFSGEIDTEGDWQIGLIVGNSGTGKTIISRQLFGTSYLEGVDYAADSVIDDMPPAASVDDITAMLSLVGFSSPPSWLKPYRVLSNGEKMRVDLARALLDDKALIVFDEYTSVVDRTVAKNGAYATQKAIRRQKGKRFIAVSCHEDVEEWLMPDWVFSTNSMSMVYNRRRYLRRPPIRLEIRTLDKSEKAEVWNRFRRYHYLDHSHRCTARAYVVYVDDTLCGFCSVLHYPHATVSNFKRAHRFVVLPDYQGIGIGHALINYVAQDQLTAGNRFLLVTSAYGLIHMLRRDPDWECFRSGRAMSPTDRRWIHRSSRNRATTSWEYLGPVGV